MACAMRSAVCGVRRLQSMRTYHKPHVPTVAPSGGAVRGQSLVTRGAVMTSPIFCPRPLARYQLDIDDLIREVHYRPAIWNKRSAGYADRKLKLRMWDEVCENIIENWSKLKMTQQITISAEIQKKWRNVKDAFYKEMKKKAAGQDVKKKQYCHSKALSFLSNSEAYISKRSASIDVYDDDSDNTSVDHVVSTSSTRKRTRKKSEEDEDENSMPMKREKMYSDEENSNSEHGRNTDKHDDNLLEFEVEKSDYSEEKSKFTGKQALKTDEFRDNGEIKYDWDNENTQIPHNDHNYQTVNKYDEDVSFTEMIIPMLKKLNDDQKHFAKIEMLNILHKARYYHPSVSCETQTE